MGDYKEIIDRLVEERIRQGKTQTEIAHLTGLTQPVIARLEAKKHAAQIDTILKIVSALRCELVLGGLRKYDSKEGSADKNKFVFMSSSKMTNEKEYEISEFFGLSVRMIANAKEGKAGFRLVCNENVGVFDGEGNLIFGEISKDKKKLFEAWMLIHEDELRLNLDLIEKNKIPKKIRPLR